jgi:DNA polymerase III subunit delta'
MHFICGQKRIKNLLSSSISRNRLAHAYLFYGPPGVGMDAVALGMAMGLNCTDPGFEGCGRCDSCRRILRFEHAAFRMVYPVPTRPKTVKEEKYQSLCRETILQRIGNPYREPDAFSEASTLPIIGIEDIAGMKRDLSLKLSGRQYRALLISHADRMTVPASNSLLKLLEEPPEGAVFFLTTSNPSRLLPTIVSRCQKMRFDSLTDQDIADALTERWQFPPERASFFARLSGGSLEHALVLSEEGFQEKRDGVLGFIDACFSEDPEIRYSAVANAAAAWEKTEMPFILQIANLILRDLFYLQTGVPEKVMNSDRIEKMRPMILKCPRFEADRAMHGVQRALDMIQKNVYLPLVVLELGRQLRESFILTERQPYGKSA